MRPAGEAAWAARRADREGVYSFEQREAARLDAEQEAAFRADPQAWEWFQAQAPSYRRTAISLGDQRQAPGDAGQAAGHADRRLGRRPPHRAAQTLLA